MKNNFLGRNAIYGDFLGNIWGLVCVKNGKEWSFPRFLFRHVHKYEAVLWVLEKLRKTIFCYKMINFSLRELKSSGNMFFSYTKRLASANVEKVLWLKRNDKKVTLLLIYYISGF